MRKRIAVPALAVAGLLVIARWAPAAHGQSQESSYDHHAAFAPGFFADGGNLFRSADGQPGARYWQNEADYHVEATLDTAAKSLSGTVQITYTNDSPSALKQLWLQLVYNSQRGDSRARAVRGAHAKSAGGDEGFHLRRVRIQTGGAWHKADYVVAGTRMQIRLPEALEGNGASMKIEIAYEYALPENARSSYAETENGTIYEVAYWYPRMCVYDDLRGWNTLPFLGAGEFYLDYGTIDYEITLPEGMLVAGSGTLQNPEETLTAKEQRRLQQARRSDETVMIRSEDDLDEPATAEGDGGMLTWHYRMENTRDAAWAASEAFLWDAARASFESGGTSLAMSVYPAESAGPEAWGRATEYLKRSLEIFSDQWMPYPYASAINVGGPTGGMEFPGITFDSWKAEGYTLFLLVSHEIGHNWFPMVVGSNERRHAWMDEGFNTFIDIYAHEQFNGGEYAPKRDGEYAPGGGNPAEEIVPVITAEDAQPIMTRADGFKGGNLHPTEYFKPAFGLVLLREVVLGRERFDYAFRQYMHDWKFKHPGPADFFRAMNNYSGEDLSWFWRGWFVHNWKLDQAVAGVEYAGEGTQQEAEITLRNLDQMVMPVLLTVETAQGETRHYKLPVEVWMHGPAYTFRPPVDGKITRVQLDPDHRLPDVSRENDEWTAEGE